jgi:outer membrane protein OmpA-like peptidoglycan-associated protein
MAMIHRKLMYRGVVLAAGGVALAACSSTPAPNANLNQAKATYAEAANDPMVRQTAPMKLSDAQDALNAAQSAWNNNEDKAVVDHNAYLAQRYSQTAMEMAKVRTNVSQASAAAREITLPGMLFQTGKADLNAQGEKAVGDIATFLHSRPDRTVEVIGHTDSTGSAQTNAKLSEARAEAVKTALVKQGVEASRIQTKGVGPSNPVASNATPEGRQQNRRVVIDISGAGGMAGSSSN